MLLYTIPKGACFALFVVMLSGCSNSEQRSPETILDGEWKIAESVPLGGSLFTDSLLHKTQRGSSFVYKNGSFAFHFTGTISRYDFRCRPDSVNEVSLKFYEHDVNDHLRASSRWYGYLPERDSVDFIKVCCPNSTISFEILGQDTLGYFYDGRLFLFAKE